MNSFFVELKEFETVLVAGPDAAKFLQGQLTCDVHALSENSFTRSAACNNKGRIFAAFILARHDDDFHVLLPNGLAKTFVTNLQKFIPFYKCSMQVISGLKSIGLAGSGIVETLKKCHLPIPVANNSQQAEGIKLYNLRSDNTQFILIADEVAYPAIRSTLACDLPEAPYERWELTDILSGHFPFTSGDVDKYTPQELHFDETGYVSFTKGCYTGQEIVARMHYRGKVKKRLFLLQIANFIQSGDGIEILDDNDNNLGLPIKQLVDNKTLFAIASLPAGLSAENLHTRDGQSISYRPFTADVNLIA